MEYKTLWRPDRAGHEDGMIPSGDKNFRDATIATGSKQEGGGGSATMARDSQGTDLVPGVVYRLRVQMKDSGGEAGPWSYITVTVVNGVIPAPYITSLAEGRTGSGNDREMTVTLGWESHDDAEKYEIWRTGSPNCSWNDFDTDNNSECKKFQTDDDTTSYTDSDGIQESSRYLYVVYAVDEDDKVHYGQWHGQKGITTSSDVDNPPPPGGLTGG